MLERSERLMTGVHNKDVGEIGEDGEMGERGEIGDI